MNKRFKLNKILLIVLSVTVLNGKDFYYSFIDNDISQISEFKKQQILSGNYKLENIRRLIREGQLDDAYNEIVSFREKNKIQLLKSQAILIYADVLYKRGGIKSIKTAITLLTTSIDNSEINKDDLLEAYRLLVVLNIAINKADDARYYAISIDKTFDDPLAKAYGKIALSQIYIHKRSYKQAINILYEILVKTDNIKVATVVADVLFDAYILDGQREKAYDLVGKVLTRNIDYYANDSFLALKKVDKLLDADMPEFAIEILKRLLEKAVDPASISRFKFRLANTYMKIAGQNPKYLSEAKELYRDLIAQKQKTPYYKQVRMAMDEILMREGKIEPAQIANQYPESESMEQKVLLQELLNAAKMKDYASIIKLKKVYMKISDTICKRFGFKNISEVYDTINAQMIAYYLDNGKCIELSQVIKGMRDQSLEVLIKDEQNRNKFFSCLVEIPDKRSYAMAKRTFESQRDPQIYLYLEKIALQLDNIDDAYNYVQKIDMVNNEKIKSEEFLDRFLVYAKLNSISSMEQFFRYAQLHPEYVKANENDPRIIDFYYQYYLYLMKNKDTQKAVEVLNKLYDKQNEMKAYVYSPFVELELSKQFKLDDNYTKALSYLDEALNNTRSINDNQLAQVYYETAKLYEKLSKNERYKQNIDKCKELKNANNFYKKMCDQL